MTDKEINEWKTFVAGTINADDIITTLKTLSRKNKLKTPAKRLGEAK